MRREALFAAGILALGMCAGWLSLADEPPTPASSANTNVVQLKGTLLPRTNAADAVKFKTESGIVYTLVSNQPATALFRETKLAGHTLLLKGRATGQKFEVTGNLRSLHDRKLHDLFYYCDICSIKTSDAGPCLCCREPVRITETPIGEEP